MKKTLLALLLLVVLTGTFLVGAWYSHYKTAGNKDVGGRKILHYVDPMNPAHTSDEPGTAPCGMPMEPVYADEGSAAQAPETLLMSPGTVRINPQKRQIIGIKIGTVEKLSETHKIRALGRVAANENRIYRLIAATDGWMSDIHEGTTGSLVEKNQLLGLIYVYDYDFFTWQQRYIAELANRGQLRHPNTPTKNRQAGGMQSGSMQSADQPMEDPMGMPDTPAQDSTALPKVMQDDMITVVPHPGDPDGKPLTWPSKKQDMPHEMDSMDKAAEHLPGKPISGTSQKKTVKSDEKIKSVTLGLTKRYRRDPIDERADSVLYANKSELELLDLGVGESQLKKLSRTGGYVSNVELRSPVSGLVISRNVSPRQKIDRGLECFTVADINKVWVIADIFNDEAQYIRPGISARVSLPNHTTTYEAKVSQVFPRFDASTRTLKVRLEMDNPNYLFLPEMFVDVEFLITFPQTITIPADAVIDSGMRKIVFAALGNGFFEPRAVETGWRFGDRIEIVKGLTPGEQIVVSGNFLIDSESRMKLAVAGFYGAPENCPVCGMDVYPDHAKASGFTVDYQGKTYSLCDNYCKKEFNRAPQSFMKKETGDKTEAVTPK